MALELTAAIALIVLGSHLAIYEVVTFAKNLATSMGLNEMIIRAIGVVVMGFGAWLMFPGGGS